MIRDGNFDRAERALEQVDTTGEDVDLPRYYTLRGLVNVRTGDFAGAIDSFLEARAAGTGRSGAQRIPCAGVLR
jgi:hypothetical protein